MTWQWSEKYKKIKTQQQKPNASLIEAFEGNAKLQEAYDPNILHETDRVLPMSQQTLLPQGI